MTTNETFASQMHKILLPRGTCPPESSYVLVLGGYFDESFPEDDAPVTVFAGFLSSVALWQEFEAEWIEMLKKFRLWEDPGFFHMTEFNARKGPYSAMSDDDHRLLLETVLDIILKHVVYAVGVALPTSIAEQFVPETERNAYFYAALFALSTTTNLVNASNEAVPSMEPMNVAYVFDYLEKGHGHVVNMLDDLMLDEEAKNRLGFLSYTYGSKKKYVPLQAADVLANELRRDWKRHATGERMRYPLRRLRKYLIHCYKFTGIEGKTLRPEHWPWVDRS